MLKGDMAFRIIALGLVLLMLPSMGTGHDYQPLSVYPQPENHSKQSMHRGINIGNALEAPNEGDWGVHIEDEYFRIIKEAGFDTVRIPIRWSAHSDVYPPYKIHENFLARVDHVVNKALEQNLIVIINIHHYEEIMQDPEGQGERLIALWKQISEHYKDYPGNLYFELLNEPYGALTSNKWNRLMNETIEVIRESNPMRKIVVGPTNWNSIYYLDELAIPNDENIIVTFHFYTPFDFTHQGAEWVSPSPMVGRKWFGTEAERKQITNELDMAVKWATQHNNITLFMGEFGAYSKADMSSRVRWTYFVAREAERRNIAWAYWEFCSGFGVYDPDKNEWRAELLNALIPRAGNIHFVSVETAFGRVSGEGWYEEGSYATIRIWEIRRGFLIQDVFDHFEGLKPQDTVIDEKTVKLYVDGPREVKAVWRKDYTQIILLIVGISVLCLIMINYKKRRASS